MYPEIAPRKKPRKSARARESEALRRRAGARAGISRVGVIESQPAKKRSSIRKTPGGKIISIIISPIVWFFKPFAGLFKGKPRKPKARRVEVERIRRPAYKLEERP